MKKGIVGVCFGGPVSWFIMGVHPFFESVFPAEGQEKPAPIGTTVYYETDPADPELISRVSLEP
jgi:hypothetical protein